MASLFRINPKVRRFSSKAGSLLLLFQKTPVVQLILPEARVMGTSGVAELVKWTVATVAGLGVYDTVAGATAITQLAPSSGSANVPATNGTNLTFVFQLLNYPDTPGSWTVTGLPTGLNHANAKNNTIDSVSGVPTQTGTFSVKVKAWAGSNYTGDSFSKTFTMVIDPPAVTAPTVTTPSRTSIAATSATLGGNVTIDGGGTITARGVVYSITTVNSNPTIGAANVTKLTSTGTTGVFTINVTGLAPGTGYSFKAYAINSAGTTYTSPVSSFTTLVAVPTVTTPTSAGIASTSATLGGSVTGVGGGTISERGIVYSVATVNSNPTIGAANVTKLTSTGTTGVFTINATGLAPGTGYSFKAYASNIAGTTYTSPVSSFFTLAAPVETFAIWQGAQFSVEQLADPATSGPTADPDGDGISNAKEYICGLLPLTAELEPIPAIAANAGQLSVSFTAKAASGPGYTGKTRHYALESTDHLVSGTWISPVGYEDIIASDQNVNYSGTQAGPTRFYHLRVWLTP